MADEDQDDKVNVLLVDDQPGKLLSYEAVLADLGENLIRANSAREALNHLLANDIAVILIDVCMPEFDGFDLVAMIREHPRFDATAIILVSAVFMSDVDRIRGYQGGAIDYVSVPIVPEILRAKVAAFADLYRKTRQLETLNKELEQRVERRTAELAKSEEALREADRRKDQFLAMLSHELRNPLASVRNVIEILRLRTLDDPGLLWCRDVIERQVGQLTRLVDDLLDVSRIRGAKIKLRMAPLDLRRTVADSVETDRPMIERLRHELTVSIGDQPLPVLGDTARLTQVMTNLLHNAAKFQDEGGRIFVSVGREGGEAVVRVRDEGLGLAPEMLPLVFDFFMQAEGTLDRARGGLGLGLSLVRTLVEMHGGRVIAASEGAGRGSEFTVRLPCLVVGEASRTAPAAERRPRPGSRKRVLVADDNHDAADSLAMVLRSAGHEILVAHDGREALRLAVSERPAAVLLDLAMPGMDGLSLCRELRERGLADTLIVAVTGCGQEADELRSQEAGFDRHLVKPVEPAVLLELLERSPAAARAIEPCA